MGKNKKSFPLKTVVVVGTLDTKAEEVGYIKEKIEKGGCRVIVIDPGILGKPGIPADFPREKVAEAGGKTLQEIISAAEGGADRAEGTNVMIRGVVEIVKQLYSSGDLDGIISLGGSTGTAIGTTAMKALPIGVPKLAVTTYVDLQYLGNKDITIMQTPADILGLNAIMRKTLSNAAAAIAGMAQVELPKEEFKPLIGLTALGLTTPGVLKINLLLKERGYDPIAFHAKTEVLNDLIREGQISGVIDLTTFEVLVPITYHMPESVVENRLSAAGERGIPQIIVPGGLDMHIFGGTKETIPPEYKDRKLHIHGPNVVLARTTKDEVAKASKILAKRANKSRGPVAIVVPLRGFSDVDKEGEAFYDPEADRAFGETMKETVKQSVEVVEVDAHINDQEFAEQLMNVFDKITSRSEK